MTLKSRANYSRKIVLNRTQIVIQTILIVGTAVILSFCYFFIFGVDDSINEHDNGIERTLILNKVILEKETFEQLIEDVKEISEVESAKIQITDMDQLLVIKLVDYRLRQTVIKQLPPYIESAGILYHQIEAYSSQIVKFKIAGFFAVGILMIVYMIFFFGLSSHIGKCYKMSNELLIILGYSNYSRFKMSLVPYVESSLFAGIIFFLVVKLLVSPPINSLINNVNQLSRFGIEYNNSIAEIFIMIGVAIIFSGSMILMLKRKIIK